MRIRKVFVNQDLGRSLCDVETRKHHFNCQSWKDLHGTIREYVSRPAAGLVRSFYDV